MLEYYEGILIMTTNRMGIIDIAFQSRIHLAVKYDELTTDLRKEIWVHFIQTLRDKDKKVKVELLHRVDELAERPLNGRQIRNVLVIAQSMALSDTQHSRALTFEHLEDVIDQTLEFQDYFTQNQVAQGATLGQIDPQWGKKAERRR
jgi:AAA+ superfamily predicted ATPase